MKLSQPMCITNACVAQPAIILVILFIIFGGATIVGFLSGHFDLKPSYYREGYAWDTEQMRNWDAQ